MPLNDAVEKVKSILSKISRNCDPSGFVALALTSQDFVSAAAALTGVDDEAEFQRIFGQFVILMLRFHSAFQQSYDMGLLKGIDEKTPSGPLELRALDRASAISERRTACLSIVCRSAEAAACFIGIRRFPNLPLPWTQMFNLAMDYPLFVPLFRSIDIDRWKGTLEKLESHRNEQWDTLGYQHIDIRGSCYVLGFEAGAMWVRALLHGADHVDVAACARPLRRLVSFLTLPAQERWILQEFRTIASTDSLQALLAELFKHDLRSYRPPAEFQKRWAEEGLTVEDEPLNALWCLADGWLRKRKYVVSFPGLPYFVDRLSQKAIQEATADQIYFLRMHYMDVADSIAVKAHKLRLLRIEALGTDKQFQDVMGHLLAHLVGEVFAAGVAQSVGASPEASIFIAGTFGAIVDVTRGLIKNEARE